MPIINRINSKTGDKTKIFVSDALWARIKKKSQKGQFRFELIPNIISKNEISDKTSSIYAGIPKKSQIKTNDDLAESIKIPEYTEENYRTDLKSARLALKKNDKEKALALYKKAFEFKNSIYVKGQINKLS